MSRAPTSPPRAHLYTAAMPKTSSVLFTKSASVSASAMLKALVLAVLLAVVQAQRFNDFQFADPFANFNWQTGSQFPSEAHLEARDVEAAKDREPLDPNYKDPVSLGSEEKPVLQPKPEKPDKPEVQSFNPSALPGGVVDVDAGNPFSGFPASGDDFGFSSFGNQRPPSGLFGLGGFFGSFEDFKPWWKGPNICIEREESTDDDDDDEEPKKNDTEKTPNFFSTAVSLSNCHQTENKYECVTKINNHGVVKTFTVRYKCCYGFARTKGTSGCEKQIELKPLLETIEELGAKEYRNLIRSTGLDGTFKEGNFTVFVPTDEALNEFNEKMLDLNNVHQFDAARSDPNHPLSNADLVLSHAVPGFVDLTDLGNEALIFSENKNSSIRINAYPTQTYEKIITANCARIIKPDNLASNGIVHLLSGVSPPATQSIQDIIRDHPKLSNLRQVFENTDSFKKLRADGHYTVFAPSDSAFNKLDSGTKQKLLRGDSCAVSILKYHITAHTVCSCAINGNATTHNVEGEVLNLERTSEDQLLLEDKAKITEADIMATNGVIHVIDEIIIPESALRINAALKVQNLTKFRALIEDADFVEDVDNLSNATVFAPSDEAFKDEKVAKYLEDIKDDKEKIKDLILYHTLPGQLQSCDMNNNEMLKSNDHDKELRLNLYSTLPLFSNVINRATVNCAKLIAFDEKSCGSVIHEVDKVLIPPTETILDIVEKNEKYSTLRKIINGTDVEGILREANGSITLLAPTDETFAALDEADLKTLMEDKEKASAVLKNHILTEVLCCAGVGPQTWGFNSLVPTLSHNRHQVGRTGSHQIRIGRAVVTSCDNLATNGIVHTINKVLFPQRHQAPSFGGFVLFDL